MKSERFIRLLYVCTSMFLLLSLMFTWHSVPESYQTDSEQLIYLHSEESLVPVHMHSSESLVPIHMNSNVTLTPIHMNSEEPYQEHIYDPICTYWHEIYPNYCPIWHLTSWKDTGEPYGELSPNDQIDMTDEYGNVSWFHVDRMTVTLELNSYDFPGEIIKVEFKGPPEMPPQEALYYPICTYWHEVWSIYSNVYHLIGWNDNNLNGILDFCDDITLNFTRGVIEPGIYTFHVDGVYNDIILRWKMMNPKCTWWHEIYPDYCRWHHLTSWEDTGWPEDQLSPSDQIDMLRELTWDDWDLFWSIGDVNRDGYIDDIDIDLILRASGTTPATGGTPGEWGAWNPAADLNGDDVVDHKDLGTCGKNYGLDIWTYFTMWYHVDRVTITLNVSSQLYPTEWMKIELKTLYFEEMYEALKHPVGSLWHEVYPNYCNVYELIGWDWWYDDNCNGVLDACDYIWLLNLHETEPIEKRYHIEDVCYDIILNKKIMDPRCTYWHEIHPNYCQEWHLTSWEERLEDPYPGRLSPSDQIDMKNTETGEMRWYHVDRVTLTLILSNLDYPEEIMYVELKEPFEEVYWFKTAPEGSLWHEVWPDYSSIYYISYWWDNCNGVLDYCDTIELTDMGGFPSYWHIEDLAIDIILNEKITDPVCTYWHELWPNYCNLYHLSSWEDNGDGLLSPCDQIDMEPVEPPGPIEWYHVEEVTLTLFLSSLEQELVTMYIEFDGGFEEMYLAKTNPVCTYWHEIYPEFCTYYHLSSWEDNYNGVLDYCDIIDLTDVDTQEVTWWHVEEVAIDIVVTKKAVPPPTPPMYWKENYPDYAPSGVPDFDQRQDAWWNPTLPAGLNWTWCAPTAVANSLWWYDSKYETNTIPPPAIIDNYPLVTSYNPGVWDDHDPQNVQPFIQHLAYLMDTDGVRTGQPHLGTRVWDMQTGIAQYLSWTGVNPRGDVNGDGTVNQTDLDMVSAAFGASPGTEDWNMAADIYPVTIGWPTPGTADNYVSIADVNLVATNMGLNGTFYEQTIPAPEFPFIEDEIERSEDVILVLGFWLLDPDTGDWVREEYPYPYESGHCVTAAGVNSTSMQTAISDPIHDNAEPPPQGTNGPGRVLPPPPHGHPATPPETVHNNASYVSHDVYNVTRISPPLPPCPGGNWALVDYSHPQIPPMWNWTVIEWAVVISPAVCRLQPEWNHKFGAIDYFQTFCPSPGVADLGVNKYHGEPDADLEIITGTDEWHGYQKWYCFDSTGGLEWTLPTGCDESRTSVAIADIDNDGDLEIAGGTTSGWELQVFDHTGSFIWTYYPGYYVFWKSSPAICEVNPQISGKEVIAATYEWNMSTVYCFNGITGAVLWKYTINAATESSPACGDVDNDGDVEVVIGATDSKVYCFNGRTGVLERTYATGGAVYSSAALVDLDTDANLEVVVGSNDGKVYCFDGGTATVEWTYQTGGSVFSSPAIGDVDADGRYEVVVGSNDGKIHCLSAFSGTLEWAYATGGAVISSPALANRGGVGLGVYVGSMDGNLYLLNGTDGALISNFNTGATNGITSSPAVADIDGDNKLEVMFTDWNAIPDDNVTTNIFWCLVDCGSNVSKYAIEWQMFRHDACRTGLYGIPSQPPPIHDVAIIGVKLSKATITTGETVTINVTAQNQGTSTETFTVSVAYDGNPMGSQTVTNLASGATTTKTFSWPTTGVAAGSYNVNASAGIVPGETDIADNSYTVPIKMLPTVVHDVAILNVAPSKVFIVAGETVTINVTAQNQGTSTETFTVSVAYDGNPMGSQTVTNLASGATTTKTFSWPTTGVPKGAYTLTATASTVPGETDTADNTFSTFIQVRTPVHDIAIASFKIDYSKTVIAQNYTEKIYVGVINQGDYPETFSVSAYYNGNVIETQPVSLASASSKILNFTWDTAGVSKGNYTISANATVVPGETDTADNSMVDSTVTVTIPGDCDGDFDVDSADLFMLAPAYGSEEGDPLYEANCDFDGDGDVDSMDLFTLAPNYGKIDP